MKITKARIIYEYSKEQGWDSFMWGDGSILDELFEVAGLKAQRIHDLSYDHPIDKWAAVLTYVRRTLKRNGHYLKNYTLIYVVCKGYHMDTSEVFPYFEGSRVFFYARHDTGTGTAHISQSACRK